MDSGTMGWQMAELDVAAVLAEAARTYAPLIGQAGLDFCGPAAPELPAVCGDHDRLLQVVGNLLNNALKFTAEGSITLSAEAADGEVRIAVKDTGAGIAEADQKRVFQRFYQAPPGEAAVRQRGTGLGLTISHEIVAHHGGRMWVESEPGQGSAFWVALPALATSRSAERQPAL